LLDYKKRFVLSYQVFSIEGSEMEERSKAGNEIALIRGRIVYD